MSASRPLTQLLNYPRQDVQDALRTAFLQIGDPAIPALLDLLDGRGTTKELQAMSLLGKLKATDWPKLTQALNDLTQTPMFIDDTPGLSPTEIRARARRLQRQRQR